MVCQFCWPAGCLRYGHPREPALQALLGSQVPAPDSDSTFPALFLTSPLQKTSSLGFAQQRAQLGSSHCDKEQSTLCGVSPGVQLYHRSSHCSLCLRRPVVTLRFSPALGKLYLTYLQTRSFPALLLIEKN